MKADEKRLYQRVSFEVQAKLKNDETALLCDVVDLSIHGALLKPTQAFDAAVGDSFELSIPLLSIDDSAERVCMSVNLKHIGEEGLGLECLSIDLDSITHLRKIVELNSGSPDLLERELALLVAQ